MWLEHRASLIVLAFAVTACGNTTGIISNLPTLPSDALVASPTPRIGEPVRSIAPTDNTLLAAVRRATASFHNIEAAFAAGYVDDGFGCVDGTTFGLPPSAGAMGFHLIHEGLHADPATDPLRPDLLVYEPARGGGRPKLVAVEYEVNRADWHGAGNVAPPSLLGQTFESIDFEGLQLYGLHLWLWRDNPSGMFADFNPKVSCH